MAGISFPVAKDSPCAATIYATSCEVHVAYEMKTEKIFSLKIKCPEL
jgi:hypothetical protein